MSKFSLRFNKWYDSLNEPWRMMLMVAMALPLILANFFSILTHFLSGKEMNPIFWFVGAGITFFFVFIRILK